MTTAIQQPLYRENNDRSARKRATFTGCLFAAALCLSLGSWWMEQVPPPPNYSGYYDGAWVNKRGELISEEGGFLRQIVRARDSAYVQFLQ